MGYEVDTTHMFGFKFEGFGDDLSRDTVTGEYDEHEDFDDDLEELDEIDENSEDERFKKLEAYCKNLGLDIGLSYDDQSGCFEDLVVGINLQTGTFNEINNINTVLTHLITKSALKEISEIVGLDPVSDIPAVHTNYSIAW